jgi:polyisoprenyl-phosphate glycosyltransferase
MASLEEKVKRLQGPVLVLGASGFIGANLLRTLLEHRADAFGTYFHTPAWRLEGLPSPNLIQTDLLIDSNLDALFARVKPKTVFNCVAYGAYSFETDSTLILQTNFNLTEKLVRRLASLDVAAYVHAGSSSEYGDNASAPAENAPVLPNSDYAVSKAACANLLYYYGRKKGLPCANLRLYSIYGPLEDSSRLVPNVVRMGLEGKYPDLVDPDVSRDFVYVADACEAFLDTALNLKSTHYGDSFNVGSGQKTTIADVARAGAAIFHIKEEPRFQSMPNRKWDLAGWFADNRKAREVLGWSPRTTFAEGLSATARWYEGLADPERYRASSKKFAVDSKYSLSVVVACQNDAQAIPLLYDRLKRTLEGLKVDYEIIFVDDNSSDGSEEAIVELSRRDRRVVGVTHSRQFGSQAAFRSGLELSTMNGCVLLEGNLQDPPELIEQFVAKWKEGYGVVYGHLTKRLGPFYTQWAYRLFYRMFNYFSYMPIPVEAGDFSLIDRRVARAILEFPERDFFLRGIRAYVGFKQVGVDYERAKRPFGSRLGLIKGLVSAKTGILSFSYTPLTMVSFLGTFLFFTSCALAVVQVVIRLLFPALTPKGDTTLLLAILFFGSINLFGLAILGEYIAKIFQEVKQRPRFLRRGVIKGGEVRSMVVDS